MIKIDDSTPTSELLSLKEDMLIGDDKGNAGFIKNIDITTSDEYWQFIFSLDSETEIEIRKIKNVC